jgi:ketosteroid isomerase-like protein
MPYPEDSTFDDAVEKEEEKESGRVVGLDPGAPDRAGEVWVGDSPVAPALANLHESLTIAALETDIDRMLSLHTTDTILLPGGGTRRDGREELRRYLEGVGGAGFRFLSLLTEPTDVWQSDPIVVEIGTFRAGLDDPEARGTETRTGNYVRVHSLQEDGTLKIRATMWNDD